MLPHRAPRRLAILLWVLAGIGACAGQTIVQGAASGVWEASGNPYIIADNTWVTSGQSLTINPGVVVQIAPSVTFEVYGRIVAKGAPSDRIKFTSVSPTTTWDSPLLVNYASGSPSYFSYCDFERAGNALKVQILDRNASTTVKILNCNFRDCSDYAFFGLSRGKMYQNMGGFHYFRPTLKVDVRNCKFESCAGGIKLRSEGTHSAHPWYGFIGNLADIYGNLVTNIFSGVTGTALHFEAEAHTRTAYAGVANSVFSQVGTGIEYQSLFTADVKNSIFVDSSNGLVRNTAAGSATYNAFWNCTNPFTGYSSNHGTPLLVNRNGTPCDIGFNIFEDPLFVPGPLPFALGDGSPCCDSGDPSDPAFFEVIHEDGPCRGTSIPDQGACGSADAYNWLDVVPFIAPQLLIAKSGNTVNLTWTAIPRCNYEVHESDSLGQWNPTSNGSHIPYANPASHQGPVAAVAMSYYRVTHLGRTPGN